MATGSQEINWQEKYLQQIDARLLALQNGQAALDAKIEDRFTRLDSKIEAEVARLDGKIDGGLREVRRLQWGTIVLVATAVLGALIRR